MHSWNSITCNTAPAVNDCDMDIFDMSEMRKVSQNPILWDLLTRGEFFSG